jgi:hypothetical protein
MRSLTLFAITVAYAVFGFTLHAFAQDGWVPEQIWVEKDGWLGIDIEHVDHDNSAWEDATSPSGFVGDSYQKYVGSGAYSGVTDDHSGEHQPPQDERLIFRLWVADPGPYKENVVNFHRYSDGDNDAWYDYLGRDVEQIWPVKRIGDRHDYGGEGRFSSKTGFSWLDFGHKIFFFERGMNAVYIGGRSKGFGVDYINIRMPHIDEIHAKAYMIEQEDVESEMLTAVPDQIPSPTMNVVNINARDFPWEQNGFVTFTKGEKVVGLPAGTSGGTKKRLSTTFTGESMTYHCIFTYFTNPEGRPTWRLYVNETKVGEFLQITANAGGLWTDYIESVDVNTGDEITVEVETNGEATGTFRAVTFVNTDPYTTLADNRLNPSQLMRSHRCVPASRTLYNLRGQKVVKSSGRDLKTGAYIMKRDIQSAVYRTVIVPGR